MLADESLVVLNMDCYGIMTGFVFKKSVINKFLYYRRVLILIMMLIAGESSILYYIA